MVLYLNVDMDLVGLENIFIIFRKKPDNISLSSYCGLLLVEISREIPYLATKSESIAKEDNRYPAPGTVELYENY